MKFYNPFKPHIVKNGHGHWYVRKLVWSMLFLKLESFYLDYNYQWDNSRTTLSRRDSWQHARDLLIGYKCYIHNDKLAFEENKRKNKETVVHGKPE